MNGFAIVIVFKNDSGNICNGFKLWRSTAICVLRGFDHELAQLIDHFFAFYVRIIHLVFLFIYMH